MFRLLLTSLKWVTLGLLVLAVFETFRSSTAPLAAQTQPAIKVDYAKEVQPILARHCYACHGPDKQSSGLRLDRKALALRGGDSGVVLVPGESKKSLLIQLVKGEDAQRMMPPKGVKLTQKDIATLQTWIDQGAPWPDDGSKVDSPVEWWSFRPLKKPTPPAGNAKGIRNEVDQFIRAKLLEKKLSPSLEADRRTLIRRLAFDLVGLPPTFEEVEAFTKNDDPRAYEQLVDRLLASPHYGERWARHWLDVVHFGETHGYDKDKPRPNAWPYRDYVIRSLNQDKPYSRFVAEQIAGDVLDPKTVDGIEALGFLAAGPWDFIGHAEVPESKIDGRVARHLDRDDFVSNTLGTFMALTVHCAQCHNHKFDPIPQEDYYRLQAVFAAIDRTDKTYDADPALLAKRQGIESKKIEASQMRNQLLAKARQASPEWAKVEVQLREAEQPAMPRRPAEHGYHSAISSKADSRKWVQVDLEKSTKLAAVELKPCHDDFNRIGAGFGFPVRFKIELSDDPNFQTGVELVADQTGRDFPNPGLTPFAVKIPQKSGRYLRVTATQLAPRQNDFIFALAELTAADETGKNVAQGRSVTALDSIEAPIRWRKANLTDGLFPSQSQLSDTELSQLRDRSQQLLQVALKKADFQALQARDDELRKLETELAQLGGSQRTAYVGAVHTGSGAFSGTGSKGGTPRPIHLLSRGDVTRPIREVGPGPLSKIPGLPTSFALPEQHREGDRRLALARWIIDDKNPLTWRVMANRIWQYHFGRGLVDTPNDFGKMGLLPSHPELLDWLACELRDHQSLKKLHKTIVMSATYRQTTSHVRQYGEVDSENRYLWRQNRRKLEAEVVRDAILQTSGKLDLKMGGPSFQDFVIEKPEHSPHYQYHLSDPDDAKTHRRAVYRFSVRSQSQPFMAALDCADPSLAVEKRNQTLSPQQALAQLNNRLVLSMAGHFAARVEKAATDDSARIAAAFRFALARNPTPQELDLLRGYLRQHGLSNTCRMILNLNEFVFVD